MNKSDSISELTKALVKVQSQLGGARLDSSNPFFKSKYASLSAVWDACRKLLADNELAVIQTTSAGNDNNLIIDTTLSHSSGEWITGELPMILPKNDPQGIGSAITYGRRYGLSAIIGICPEDDDAESAMERSINEKKPDSKSKDTVEKNVEAAKEDTNSVDRTASGEPHVTLMKNLEIIGWKANNYRPASVYIQKSYGVGGETFADTLEVLSKEQYAEFSDKVQDMVNKKVKK